MANSADRSKNFIDSMQLSGTLQNIRAGNLDGDSYDEMIVDRGRNPGKVYALKYNNAAEEFTTTVAKAII